MEVILLEKVHNLGTLGDRVKVKPGYGRNFLIPQGKALSATPGNMARFEAERARLEAAHAAEVSAAEARAHDLHEAVVTIAVRASNDGRLFGSVGAPDIAQVLTDAGHPVDRREVRLPNGPLRDLGEYPVQLMLHADVLTTITVRVLSENELEAAEAKSANLANSDSDDDADSDDE